MERRGERRGVLVDAHGRYIVAMYVGVESWIPCTDERDRAVRLSRKGFADGLHCTLCSILRHGRTHDAVRRQQATIGVE